jgi:hypothetical protein
MTRAQALAAAAVDIAKSVPDLVALISLLDIAGQRRLATALRGYVVALPAEVGGKAHPNPEMWTKGRVG